jgi:uncharacterized DUF497 family protein
MAYNENVEFDWDERKNQANRKKHGISFEEAQSIWTDVKATEFFDSIHSWDEERFVRIGTSTRLRVLVVVFCEREQIRIVSARRATALEQEIYEKGI